jgi:tRNA(Ile)-lysidine synthase
MRVLAERVRRTIHRHGLLPSGARVLVAASGGADSTALVCLLRELAPGLHVELAGLAHFNHGLRGAASDADEQFCRDLAGRLSMPIEVGRGDVAAAARRLRTSIEDAGRQLRYAFFEQALGTLSATHVAVGHTRDDQAETVLLNILRGAGPRGLAGMPTRRGVVVRPLVDCSHDELVRWLTARGQPFREDESNRDPRYLRNRVRHELLPALAGLVPSIRTVLARLAAISQDDADLLDRLAAEAFERLAATAPGEILIDAAGLAAEPPAVSRRVARLALRNIWDRGYVGFDQADRVVAVAGGLVSGPVSCPGVQAELVGGKVRLSRRLGRGRLGERDAGASSAVNSFRAALSTPGEVVLADGSSVSSDVRPWTDGTPNADTTGEADPRLAMVDADLAAGLSVRFRRSGDRFRPLGMGGRKSLQDFFVDRKVPRAERARTPLVVDADDRIVWVAGYGIAEDFRVSDRTRAVVILRLRGERV